MVWISRRLWPFRGGKYKDKTQARDTCLNLILQGATWPAARMHEVDSGLSPECSRCGHHTEDEAHRLWFCAALDAQRVIAGVSLGAFRELGITPPRAFLYRLLVPAMWTMRPISDRCCKEFGYLQNWWQDPDWSLRFTGTVATDGSCSDPSDDRLRRAECAVVQFSPGAQPLRFGSTCPGPRTVSRFVVRSSMGLRRSW